MRTLFMFTLLLSASHLSIAQDEVQALVQKGIEYHDAGAYSKAIATYMEALQLDPQSALIHYEIAYSYYEKGDLERAIEYADVVLKEGKAHRIPAYIIKGSALDDLGKTKASIKLFEKAIKKEGGHYLLYYNLALNQFHQNQLEDAEANVIEGILLNPSHGSSHLMLAKIQAKQGHKTQAILASQFFLLLEPTGDRAVQAYEIFQRFFLGDVTRDDDQPNSITINLSPDGLESPFSMVEMSLGIIQAANMTAEENVDMPARQLLVVNLKVFYELLAEMPEEEKQNDIWWELYIPFCQAIVQTDHMEAYAMYITQVGDTEAHTWIEDNQPAMKDFLFWLEEY